MTIRILSISIILLSTLLHISLTDAQSISVNKACVTVGETFSVTFQNKNELDSDWIAMVSANENTKAFTDFGHWVWTCGTQTCSGAVAMGRVRMRASSLATGTWRAVLARDDSSGGPFAAYAKSNTFTIATSCSTSPVPAPVRSPVVVPTSTNPNEIALKRINSAKAELLGLIRGDRTLAPQFLRLGFHDCIGGCDGTLCLCICYSCRFVLALPKIRHMI